MKPFFIIALILSIASMGAAAALFWDEASKPSGKKTAPQSSVEIKWGEGSEAGAPETAVHK